MILKNKTSVEIQENSNNSVSLLNAAMQMSWRLAIVVLIPLIGGVKLDEHLKTFPYLTILGSLLAIAGVFYVLRKILNDFSQDVKTKENK
jgi:F0F1-type ATP synthase assembly protein I